MKKFSTERLDAMKHKEEQQTKAIDEFKALVEGFDGEFWGQFKKRLIAKADAIKVKREERFYISSELDLKLSHKEEDTLRFVADVPTDIVSSYRELVKQNTQLRGEIRDYSRGLRKGL